MAAAVGQQQKGEGPYDQDCGMVECVFWYESLQP